MGRALIKREGRWEGRRREGREESEKGSVGKGRERERYIEERGKKGEAVKSNMQVMFIRVALVLSQEQRARQRQSRRTAANSTWAGCGHLN